MVCYCVFICMIAWFYCQRMIVARQELVSFITYIKRKLPKCFIRELYLIANNMKGKQSSALSMFPVPADCQVSGCRLIAESLLSRGANGPR